MGYYAQLDQNGYCCCVSSLPGAITESNMIELKTYDLSYLGRKYNRETENWTEEYKSNPKPKAIESEPTKTMLMEKLKEQEEFSLNQGELFLDQQILLYNIELNTTL